MDVKIEFVDEIIGSGAMKDVYFSPDRSYVVCFFSKEKNKFYESKATFEQQKDRLKEIVGNKWQSIFKWDWWGLLEEYFLLARWFS